MKGTIYILCIIALISAMAMPATAEYVAENKKMNIYDQGAGDLVYAYGPCYNCINTSESATYDIDLEVDPSDPNVVDARLYVYWTWSLYDEEDTSSAGDDVATYPVLDVEVNGVPVSFDYAPDTNWIKHYTDAKDIDAVGEHKYLPDGTLNPDYASWNFPAGTNCSSISVDDLELDNTVTVTNAHPYTGGFYNGAKVCIQGVGILLTLDDNTKKYWIAEGNDMTYVYWSTISNKWSYGITPDDATTKVEFSGAVPAAMSTGTLTSVVPAGDLGNNRLYFNAQHSWDGLWYSTNPDPKTPDLAVSVTDVSAALKRNNNKAMFQNGLLDPNRGDKQMNIANAFLVVE